MTETWLLRVEEAAKLLQIGRNKVYELAAAGEIPSLHIGRQRTVLIGDLQRAKLVDDLALGLAEDDRAPALAQDVALVDRRGVEAA